MKGESWQPMVIWMPGEKYIKWQPRASRRMIAISVCREKMRMARSIPTERPSSTWIMSLIMPWSFFTEEISMQPLHGLVGIGGITTGMEFEIEAVMRDSSFSYGTQNIPFWWRV